MEMIKKFKPAVPKRVLFFAASCIWGFASSRILSIGFGDVLKSSPSFWMNVLVGLTGACFFFKAVFYKMYKKHAKRIINSKEHKPCFFSFFDLKGYMIMAFMIAGGISLRKADVIPSLYLGTFYITLGVSLLLASLSFMQAGVRYKAIATKYLIEDNLIAE